MQWCQVPLALVFLIQCVRPFQRLWPPLHMLLLRIRRLPPTPFPPLPLL
jgi:hypothetical protein